MTNTESATTLTPRLLTLAVVISVVSACGATTSRRQSESETRPDGAPGGAPAEQATPEPARPPEPNCAIDLAAGEFQHCAVYQNGEVWCWGALQTPEADAERAFTFSPTRVEGVTEASRVHVGAVHSCATTGQGLSCWGKNDSAQIDDSGVSPLAPTFVGLNLGEPPSPITSVGLGEGQTCIANTKAGVLCRGTDSTGQLATGVQIAGLGAQRNRLFSAQSPLAVEAGFVYSIDAWPGAKELSFFGADNQVVHPGVPACAVKANGTLWCDDNYSLVAENTQLHQTDLEEWVLSVGGGDFFVCALTESRRVWCEGWNQLGQVGRGSTDAWLLAGDWVVGLEDVRVLSVGKVSACALMGNGRVSCWGANGTDEHALAPVQVSGCEGQREHL